MDTDSLKSTASELWDTIVRLETEKYDLEERQTRGQGHGCTMRITSYVAYMPRGDLGPVPQG